MYFAALVLSLLNDGARNYCHSRSRCINIVCICDSTAGRGAAIIYFHIQVRYSSIHLVKSFPTVVISLFWSNFDFYVTAAAGGDLEPLADFLTPFLAEFIDKSCSDAAE